MTDVMLVGDASILLTACFRVSGREGGDIISPWVFMSNWHGLVCIRVLEYVPVYFLTDTERSGSEVNEVVEWHQLRPSVSFHSLRHGFAA